VVNRCQCPPSPPPPSPPPPPPPPPPKWQIPCGDVLEMAWPATVYQQVSSLRSVLWFECRCDESASCQREHDTPFTIVCSKLADEHDVEAAHSTGRGLRSTSGLWEFPVVPDAVRRCNCCFYRLTETSACPASLGRVRFPNPLYGRFPEWRPEPVPAVRKSGDLEVRLDSFMTGVRVSGSPVVLGGGQQAIATGQPREVSASRRCSSGLTGPGDSIRG